MSGWSAIPAAGAPVARFGASAVWTGKEMIVWGGHEDIADRSLVRHRRDGGRFDPESGTWRPLPLNGAPAARSWHSAVWTGSEMLVWGGSGEPDQEFCDGAAYDPAKNLWRPISTTGAPTGRVQHGAAWTGKEMLVFGGVTDEKSFVDGGRYDPSTNSWRPIPRADMARGPRAFATAWTGRELLVWGGVNGGSALSVGARYDPGSNRWRSMTTNGAPSPRGYPASVWTGDRWIIFGGQSGPLHGPAVGGGAIYDPTRDAWAPLPTRGMPSNRTRLSAAWDGDRLIVWGGEKGLRDGPSDLLGDGASWRPGENTWTPLATGLAPSARSDACSAWTGSLWIIWGGRGSVGPLADGGLLRLE